MRFYDKGKIKIFMFLTIIFEHNMDFSVLADSNVIINNLLLRSAFTKIDMNTFFLSFPLLLSFFLSFFRPFVLFFVFLSSLLLTISASWRLFYFFLLFLYIFLSVFTLLRLISLINLFSLSFLFLFFYLSFWLY